MDKPAVNGAGTRSDRGARTERALDRQGAQDSFRPGVRRFSRSEPQKVRFNPDSISPFRFKFHVPDVVESPNRMNPSDHALEEFLSAHFILHAGRKLDRRRSNSLHFITDAELRFSHAK